MPFSIILYPICLVVFYLLFIRNNRRNHLFTFCVGLYLLSAFTSIALYTSQPNSYRFISTISYVYFFTLLVLAFYPIANYERDNYKEIDYIPIRYVNLISICLILLFIPNFILSLPQLISQYQLLQFDINEVSDMYEETSTMGSKQSGSSFANVFSVIRGAFSEIIVFWTFYYLTIKQKKSLIFILLLLSSLTSLVTSFLQGSRTMMTWWMIQTIISYLIFYQFYELEIKKMIKWVLVSFISVFLIVITVFTYGRFAEDGDNNAALENFITYFGQSTLNFNNDVLDNDVCQNGDGTLPFFRKLLGLESSDNLYQRQLYWQHKMNIHQGAFYTFLGDICFDWGVLSTLILMFLFSLFFNYTINGRTYSISLNRLFQLFLLCSICCNGLFYLSYKTIGGNLKILTSVFFVLFLYRITIKEISKNNN